MDAPAEPFHSQALPYFMKTRLLATAALCTVLGSASGIAQSGGASGSAGASGAPAAISGNSAPAAGAATTSGTPTSSAATASRSTTSDARAAVPTAPTTNPATAPAPNSTSAPAPSGGRAASPVPPRAAGGGATAGAPGTPDMTPTTPSRSIIDTATPPGAPDSPTRPARAPSITAVPPQPGVSALSGIPVADIPVTSAGTAPIDSKGVKAGEPTTAEKSADALPARTGPVPDGRQTELGLTQIVPTPPPAPLPEASTTAPSPNHAWVPGHSRWSNNQWSWVNGTWQQPPAAGASWISGTYDATTHRWTAGHWSSEAR